MLRKAETRSRAQISRTHSRGANASLGIEGFVKLEIEHGLLDATGKHVPSETDHLLRPGEDVDGIVELRAQTLVSENVELAEPRVVDEAGVTQPIYWELWMVRIRDDSSNHANLKGPEERRGQFSDRQLRGKANAWLN
jgi:hypothetical protein